MKTNYPFYTTYARVDNEGKTVFSFRCDVTFLPDVYWMSFIKSFERREIDTILLLIGDELFLFPVHNIKDESTSWLQQTTNFILVNCIESLQLLSFLREVWGDGHIAESTWILQEEIKGVLIKKDDWKESERDIKEWGRAYLYLLSIKDIKRYAREMTNKNGTNTLLFGYSRDRSRKRKYHVLD